jgi:outer membrane protein assembly factor BamB
MTTPTRLFLLAGLLPFALQPALASDWPQFRGPDRSGISNETAWEPNWNAGAPKTLWTHNSGESYAAPIIVNGMVYITSSNSEKDSFLCLDAVTGEEKWKSSFDHPSRKEMAAADPRSNALTATPLFHNNRLYTITREGELFCLDAKSGATIWRINVLKKTGAKMPYFGVSSSPVLEKDLLLFNIGAGGVAVHKDTGNIVWKTEGLGGYASPVIYTRKGKREMALFGTTAVVGVEVATGKEVWRYPWKEFEYSAPSSDPVFYDNMLFVQSARNGVHLIQLEGSAPKVVWQNQNMCSDFTNTILFQGYLYGNNRNKLTCVDRKTGAVKWEMKGLGQGAITIAGDKLIAQTERGELVVAEANPEKYVEIARIRLFEGKDFQNSAGYITPTLANGRLYCRVPSGKLVCLDVSRK